MSKNNPCYLRFNLALFLFFTKLNNDEKREFFRISQWTCKVRKDKHFCFEREKRKKERTDCYLHNQAIISCLLLLTNAVCDVCPSSLTCNVLRFVKITSFSVVSLKCLITANGWHEKCMSNCD